MRSCGVNIPQKGPKSSQRLYLEEIQLLSASLPAQDNTHHPHHCHHYRGTREITPMQYANSVISCTHLEENPLDLQSRPATYIEKEKSVVLGTYADTRLCATNSATTVFFILVL